MTWARRAAPALLVLSCVVLAATEAAGAVVEPNGVSVPAPPPTGEIPLQTYFTQQGETINAIADASTTPGVFLPLCDFQATLVLSQSQAQAGINWYNQPAAPTGPPPATDLHPIGAAILTVGQTISSADIRSNPAWTGGLVGFVLMKQLNGASAPPVPVYYSEYQRNADCTGCIMPGYWKMALAYQSTVYPNSYYLAFEDWEGADQNSWQGNDGDFNDKVFRFSGVTCEGGGEACDTTMPGVCSIGVTQCMVGAAITCVPVVKPTSETCDNLDNDCNGMIDDNATCPTPGWVCDHGTCVHPCDESSEFKCVPGLQCDQGLCKDPRCVGVTCTDGKVCQAGTCVGGCDGVTCPLNQICAFGTCVDPCAGVTCPGAVCDKGACVTSCDCRVCPDGQVCEADGRCVDSGCEKLTCGTGEVCVLGACKDACADAVCPGGAACHNGVCDPPPMITPTPSGAAGTSGAGTGGSGVSGSAGTTGQTAHGGTTGTVGTGAGGASGLGGAGAGAGGDIGRPQGHGGTVTCNCTTGGGPGAGGALIFLAAIVVCCRRRARRSD
jgi:hypothetical protein